MYEEEIDPMELDNLQRAFLGEDAHPEVFNEKKMTLDLSNISVKMGSHKDAQSAADYVVKKYGSMFKELANGATPKPKDLTTGTIKGIIKVTDKDKIIKEVNKFEKRSMEDIDPKFNGENRTIDEIALKWLNTSEISSEKDCDLIVLDNKHSSPILFDAFLVYLSKGASGKIEYTNNNGQIFLYTLVIGEKLEIKEIK